MASRNYFLFVREDGQRIPRVRFGSWAFVLFSGVLLTVVAVVDRGGFDVVESTVGAVTGCQLLVSAPQLNVRSGPSADAEMVGQLTIGERVSGTTAVSDGYRELERGRWASDEYLTPVPGTNCG